jgi:hypothetical protein
LLIALIGALTFSRLEKNWLRARAAIVQPMIAPLSKSLAELSKKIQEEKLLQKDSGDGKFKFEDEN